MCSEFRVFRWDQSLFCKTFWAFFSCLHHGYTYQEFTIEAILIQPSWEYFFWENIWGEVSEGQFVPNPKKSGSSRSQMFFKTRFLKRFASFTGKQLFWSLLLIKLQFWRSVKIAKYLRTPFLQKTSVGCLCASYYY